MRVLHAKETGLVALARGACTGDMLAQRFWVFLVAVEQLTVAVVQSDPAERCQSVPLVCGITTAIVLGTRLHVAQELDQRQRSDLRSLSIEHLIHSYPEVLC